jgi:hypothetical protein
VSELEEVYTVTRTMTLKHKCWEEDWYEIWLNEHREKY